MKLHLALVVIVLALPCRAQGTIVRFQTILGNFDVSLYDNVAPVTVANFLSYVNSGAYSNTMVHRVDTGLGVIQGGGYNSQGLGITPLNPPIPLEYSLPNTRGTLSMARNVAPNSATSQWFINTDDNTTSLGTSNGGGYAVFGLVLGNGMSIVDSIADVPTFAFQTPFGQVPLQNYTQADFNHQPSPINPLPHAILVSAITVVPEPSSIALAAMGAIGLSAWGWRRRKL